VLFRVQGDPLVDKIDAILPQTQCGQCGYPGCKPYATAIAGGEADINQCPPGGDEGVRKLADLLGREYKPLNAEHGVEKPKSVAVIDEATCIGCTLCIQACPVDAIVGAAKQMHTVVADLCTGCELCVPPCPADCIDMVPVAETVDLEVALPGVRAEGRVGGTSGRPCSEGSRLTMLHKLFDFNGGVKPDPNKTHRRANRSRACRCRRSWCCRCTRTSAARRGRWSGRRHGAARASASARPTAMSRARCIRPPRAAWWLSNRGRCHTLGPVGNAVGRDRA
jgi:electron transport complex protein RnfB